MAFQGSSKASSTATICPTKPSRVSGSRGRRKSESPAVSTKDRAQFARFSSGLQSTQGRRRSSSPMTSSAMSKEASCNDRTSESPEVTKGPPRLAKC